MGFSRNPTKPRFNGIPQKGLLLRTTKIPSEYLPKNYIKCSVPYRYGTFLVRNVTLAGGVGTPSWLNPQMVTTPQNTTSSCGLYLCTYPITNKHMIRLLKALRQTVPEEEQYVFWDAVDWFSDMDMFFSTKSIRTWGWYFQLQFFTGTVAYADQTPPCPLCGGATTFELDASKAFS